MIKCYTANVDGASRTRRTTKRFNPFNRFNILDAILCAVEVVLIGLASVFLYLSYGWVWMALYLLIVIPCGIVIKYMP